MYPLDSLSFIDLKPYSAKESRVYTALKNRECFKLICGANYASADEIKTFSYIFAKAGAHIINVGPNKEAVKAAKEGVMNAGVPSEQEPQVMISLSLDQALDPRTKRRNLDELITKDSAGSMSNNLIDGNLTLTSETLGELWDLGASYIEIHVGSNFYWLESYIRKIKELSPHPWMISIVLSGQTASYNELQEQAHEIYNLLGDGALVQIDGTPIGSEMYHDDEDVAMLRALSSASAVLEIDKPLYVQIAGGVNDTIRSLLSRFGLKVHGIAMSRYPQKLIEPHLDDLETAVAIASKLVKSSKL